VIASAKGYGAHGTWNARDQFHSFIQVAYHIHNTHVWGSYKRPRRQTRFRGVSYYYCPRDRYCTIENQHTMNQSPVVGRGRRVKADPDFLCCRMRQPVERCKCSSSLPSRLANLTAIPLLSTFPSHQHFRITRRCPRDPLLSPFPWQTYLPFPWISFLSIPTNPPKPAGTLPGPGFLRVSRLTLHLWRPRIKVRGWRCTTPANQQPEMGRDPR
jgi:hypothetical protein